jgi:hypothetical protein
MGSKSSPPPPDYQGIANQEARANRPNQQNAFGSTVNWTQGPDGQWTQSQQFAGPWAGLAGNLQGQAAANMSTPFDMGQFGQAGNGDSAREQAINAMYGQATSRLDPQWQQRESQMRTQLLNEGLDPSSEAYRTAMSDMGRQRNDAYGSAMNSAIGMGQAAGDSVFRNNMMARQTAIADALRARSLPMMELAQMQGFLQQPGFNQANMLPAAIAQGNYNMDAWQGANQASADFWGGLMQLGGQLGGAAIMASDERMKTDIVRLGFEAMPGVPFATWRWKPEYEGSGRTVGVIAQDLEKVAPQYVRTRADGMKLVDYSFLEG